MEGGVRLIAGVPLECPSRCLGSFVDWYTAAEERAIDTAGQKCADTMRRLRGYDTQPDFPIDPWPAGAARGRPEQPTNEGVSQ